MRIFTSPWIRRLLTLQESALAKSLYFQFADGAVSLQNLYTALTQSMGRSLQFQSVGVDVIQEYFNIKAFFHAAIDHINLASSRPSKGDPKKPQFLVRDYQKVIDPHDVLSREGYDYECASPHVTNFGLYCPAHSVLVSLPGLKL